MRGMATLSTASTIYALASAPGKAGVAVFRISGPQARQALVSLGVTKPLAPRLASLVTLSMPPALGSCAANTTASHASPAASPSAADSPPQGAALDQALALFFPGPHSFTGEDVLELHTHGSRAVTRLLLEALGTIPGLRLAEPGEFARRAFLAGKLDLAQAEGLADLIDAETHAQHAQAIRQLGGDNSERVEALRMAILEPLALLEAYIDFPDEEIPESVLAQTNDRVAALRQQLAALLDDHAIGEKTREGLEIVIIGPPNAGKSSLLNALARRDAAIVSPEAGTTRDLIEVQMEIAGYAVTLVDTAGLREADNLVEAEGIRRTQRRAESADLTVYVHDIATLAEHADHIASKLDARSLVVLNKSDLVAAMPSLPFPALAISVETGAGMDALIAALTDAIATRMEHHTPPVITRTRHREALKEALVSIHQFRPSAPLELICEELRLTARALGKITGKIAVDDVLDIVFSRFCIGK